MIDKQPVREYLATLTRDHRIPADDSSLIGSKLLDSLNFSNLVVFLEDRYKLQFGDDELMPENFDSINAIAEFLEKKGVS